MSRPARELPSGTTLVQIYDVAEGKFLLLGEPGAGKTTMLLTLARDLLVRAEENRKYLIPVLFNLTSWSKEQLSLAEWLIEELWIKYQVPKKIARQWLEENRLALFLDGLDETSDETRTACVKAIRTYYQEHPLVSLVIGCRTAEYFGQETRLTLRSAIVVQPLTREQIHAYLTQAGERLATVRQALLEDVELFEISTNPLMLSIVIMTFEGAAGSILPHAGSIEKRRQHIFALYVGRMLERRSADTSYNAEETISWLAWLAKQMKKQSLTELYLERIQPEWLSTYQKQMRYRKQVMRLVNGVECLIIAGLFALLRGGEIHNVVGVGVGLFGWFGSGPGNSILGWMGPGLGGGLGGGGSLGIILALVTILVILLINAQLQALSWRSAFRGIRRGVRTGALVGAFVGIFSGILFTLSDGVLSGIARGLGSGLFSGLLMGLESGLIEGLQPMAKKLSTEGSTTKKPQSPSSPGSFFSQWSRRAVDRLSDFIFFGCCAGVGTGGVYALMIHAITQNVVLYGAISALFFGFMYSLGDGANLIQGLGEKIMPAEAVFWSWTQSRQELWPTLKKSLRVGFMITISVMLILGCMTSFFYNIAYGFRYALIYGLIIGVISAVAAMLAGVLNQGWSSAMIAENLLAHPNEGIHRSLKNAGFAACLFGPLGGLISGLASGLAFGYVGGLPGWPILGVGFGLVFCVVFSLQFFALYGGIAWVEHYLLRWSFRQSGNLPANCVPFLDYAVERVLLRQVGGGYMFFHSLLLDYFASLEAPPVSQRDKKRDSEA
jgi:hypothetical protein